MNENPDEKELTREQWFVVRAIHVLIGFALLSVVGLVILALAYYPIKWACGL